MGRIPLESRIFAREAQYISKKELGCDEILHMIKRLCLACAGLLLLSSCGEYYRVQKSTDLGERYSFAKKSYNEKKYGRVVSLLEDIVPQLVGTNEGPQSTYLLADAYLQRGDESEASRYFQNYYTSYPKGPMVEEARFKAGYCLFQASPDPRLDQSATIGAIKELQSYLDFYPKGKHSSEVELMLFELQDKLAYKEFLAAKLYYNLGLYLGNNYESCIITAQNALKDYPFTKHKEDLTFLILRAKAEMADLSVPEKLQERLRDVIDTYYAYLNDFPNGTYTKQAQNIFDRMNSKKVSE